MNKVISGYFDDAHRGLQRQQQQQDRIMGGSASNVQLPPLRQPDPDPSWDKVQSQSMGSLEFTSEQARAGIQTEKYQQALSDNSKLSKRIRQMQEQLAITSAKKEAFRAQATRLEKEFKKGREQADMLQKDLLEARREAGQLGTQAQEAMSMMTEMRKAHIQEVRLLQRGLAARSGGEMKNKVNEVADLVDKLGRAVMQRDESIRDKTKLQVKSNKLEGDLRAVVDDCARLKRQNKSLSAQLKEALRKAQFTPPKPDGGAPEDSDEEFEHELMAFEQRFQILEEGPAGLDILASNLSKDKQTLEKRLKAAQETNKSLTSSVENYKRLGEEKDLQIEDISGKLDKMMKDHAALQEAIAQKRREIELQVQEEKEAMARRIEELELECDNARAVADGMEKASSRLTKELVKVHETYTGQQDKKAEDAAAGQGPNLLAKTEQNAKTGESLKLEVYKTPEGVTELHASEADGEPTVIKVDDDMMKELDQADPWIELFSRVGVSPGPPRKIVISSMLDRDQVKLAPDNAEIILSIYRFDDRRFWLSGLNLATQSSMDLLLTEDTIGADLAAKLDGCQGNSRQLFQCLSSHIVLQAGGTQLALA
mmetsp:Transcript_105396/g.187427  ORF Transcript_105396/g.187427 Transcript_105396/m.187427 type:complete len:597 (+) Transcript_105396:98-1888(+)|eukprot:CAMPEP_0197650542 /NCGR_PEP_ID=MMETSP1338-20131121/31006_1 /TAXON_ID=43686 ORGANISM="Pelagodinium beii, Strain RCC1491" /NCGR_SAMPLE_ID=MMETSP1338 /ASSEMBLY_ACC=CAM_ASM_000754 /LENGTH=596 /DNA_ID=CAMNT_0043224971 /DNA_START=105 /DNA_END=1895 /DNA_ORIENTATION=-